MHFHQLNVRLVVKATWDRQIAFVQALYPRQALLADLRLQLDLVADAYFAWAPISGISRTTLLHPGQNASTYPQALRQELVLVAALVLLR